MNFVLYHIEFPHICNIYDDNTMFYIDLWGFTNDPLYLVYNSAEQENPVLCIFHFQRPIRSQIELGFRRHHFFTRRSKMDFWSRPGGLGGPKEARWQDDCPNRLILLRTDVF